MDQRTNKLIVYIYKTREQKHKIKYLFSSKKRHIFQYDDLSKTEINNSHYFRWIIVLVVDKVNSNIFTKIFLLLNRSTFE